MSGLFWGWSASLSPRPLSSLRCCLHLWLSRPVSQALFLSASGLLGTLLFACSLGGSRDHLFNWFLQSRALFWAPELCFQPHWGDFYLLITPPLVWVLYFHPRWTFHVSVHSDYSCSSPFLPTLLPAPSFLCLNSHAITSHPATVISLPAHLFFLLCITSLTIPAASPVVVNCYPFQDVLALQMDTKCCSLFKPHYLARCLATSKRLVIISPSTSRFKVRCLCSKPS